MMNPNAGMSMQPGIILLRDGTDESQGKPQLIANINACQAVAEAVRTTLGPRGMDKLIHDGNKVRRKKGGGGPSPLPLHHPPHTPLSSH